MDVEIGSLIVPATRVHIGPHVSRLALDKRAEIERSSGVSARKWLRIILGQSVYARAGLLDGIPVALWGLTGTMASSSGHVWLSVTPEFMARPFLCGRLARAEAESMMMGKTELRSAVATKDRRAHRFLRFLGFEIGDVLPIAGATLRIAVLRQDDDAVHHLCATSVANGMAVEIPVLSQMDLSSSGRNYHANDE